MVLLLKWEGLGQMGDFKIPQAHSSFGAEEWSRTDLCQSLGSRCFFLSLSLPLNLDFGVWLPPLERTRDMVEYYCILFTHLACFLSSFLGALGVGDNLAVTPSPGVTHHSC